MAHYIRAERKSTNGLLFALGVLFGVSFVGFAWVFGYAGVFRAIFASAGVAACVGVTGSYIRSRRRATEITFLLQHGRRLRGRVVEVTRNRDFDEPLYRLVAEATLLGEPRRFVSDELEGDVPTIMLSLDGKPLEVDVYIDKSNDKRFFVDTAALPQVEWHEARRLQAAEREREAAFDQEQRAG